MPARVVSSHTLYHMGSRLVAVPEVKDGTTEVGRQSSGIQTNSGMHCKGCISSVYLLSVSSL